MASDELLEEYSDSIRRLKQNSTDAGINENDFRKMYFESLNSIKNDEFQVRNNRKFNAKFKLLLVIVITIIALLITAYNFKSIYSSLVCNLQEFIYPGLKILRRISIPFISLFPSLTDFYHETCLLQNPFFTVVDMDCWPCSTVTNVKQIYDPEPVNQQHSAPFIYESDQQVVNIDMLKKLYLKNRDVFDKDSTKIQINNKHYITPQELFHEHTFGDSKNYYLWRFNNMNAARLLRQIIQRPKVVPKFGQSTERFIIIDSSQKSFYIPDTECSFSFLLALSGSRTVNLIPAEECKHQCKTLKVELKETHLLWYNWWYWRPVVLPSNGNTTLIAHVGSYC